MPPSLKSWSLPVIAAVALHAVVMSLWFGRVTGAASSPTAALRVSIKVMVDAAGTVPTAAPDHALAHAAVPAQEPSPSHRAAAVREGAADGAEPRPIAVASAQPGAVDREPMRLPYLAGEPVIDLGDDRDALTGRIELRLSIDQTGHVVDSQLKAQEGLPPHAVETLRKAFSGYVYVPAQRGGRAVASDVTVVIAVRDGEWMVRGAR